MSRTCLKTETDEILKKMGGKTRKIGLAFFAGNILKMIATAISIKKLGKSYGAAAAIASLLV